MRMSTLYEIPLIITMLNSIENTELVLAVDVRRGVRIRVLPIMLIVLV